MITDFEKLEIELPASCSQLVGAIASNLVDDDSDYTDESWIRPRRSSRIFNNKWWTGWSVCPGNFTKTVTVALGKKSTKLKRKISVWVSQESRERATEEKLKTIKLILCKKFPPTHTEEEPHLLSPQGGQIELFEVRTAYQKLVLSILVGFIGWLALTTSGRIW